jgi:phosphohistidine phosphatase
VLPHAEGATSRTLLLVRHAKSSWDDPDLADLARPLNKRGTRDAAAMAQRVTHRSHRPDLIVTSPALRAQQTAEAMAAALGLEAASLVVDERVYDATAADLVDVIRSLDDRHARVMLVGHHPGITEIVNDLADAHLEKLPTCGVAEIRLDVRSWADVRDGCAALIELDTPKKHPQ